VGAKTAFLTENRLTGFGLSFYSHYPLICLKAYLEGNEQKLYKLHYIVVFCSISMFQIFFFCQVPKKITKRKESLTMKRYEGLHKFASLLSFAWYDFFLWLFSNQLWFKLSHKFDNAYNNYTHNKKNKKKINES